MVIRFVRTEILRNDLRTYFSGREAEILNAQYYLK